MNETTKRRLELALADEKIPRKLPNHIEVGVPSPWKGTRLMTSLVLQAPDWLVLVALKQQAAVYLYGPELDKALERLHAYGPEQYYVDDGLDEPINFLLDKLGARAVSGQRHWVIGIDEDGREVGTFWPYEGEEKIGSADFNAAHVVAANFNSRMENGTLNRANVVKYLVHTEDVTVLEETT